MKQAVLNVLGFPNLAEYIAKQVIELDPLLNLVQISFSTLF